jgi:hypothetical protein
LKLRELNSISGRIVGYPDRTPLSGLLPVYRLSAPELVYQLLRAGRNWYDRLVITATEIIASAYLVVTLMGIVMSFTTHQGRRRRTVRFATVALSIPICLLVGCAMTLWLIVRASQPPTLAELKRDFPSKRSFLETIVSMSDEDPRFWRIAPSWVDRTTDDPVGFEQFMENDPKAGLSKARWDTYREIFDRNGIKLGIQRNKQQDAFIMVDSIGLLNRGHVSGYVKCSSIISQDPDRFYPCILRQDNGKREYIPDPSREGYSFQKLDDAWYAYDEGPS